MLLHTKNCGANHYCSIPITRKSLNNLVIHDNNVSSLANITLERISVSPFQRKADPKVPFIVKNILEHHSGALDGIFSVSNSPHFLSEGDVEIAAKVIRGQTGASLPIVYISTMQGVETFVKAEKLAAWLGGMAHVVVEPSRHFSQVLAREVNYCNPYCGACAVYWPYGAGRPIRCKVEDFQIAVDMATHITHIVRDALNEVWRPNNLSWNSIVSQVSKNKLAVLRRTDTEEARNLIKQFDEEIDLVKAQAELAEKEVERLRREMQRATAQNASNEMGLLKAGSELIFYEDELKQAVIYALNKAKQGLTPDGRILHLIESVIEANNATETHGLQEAIKSAFPENGKLEAKHKGLLNELGFSFSEDGKHIKMVFHDDDRYTFSIAKTPGDHRSMFNTRSKIITKLCK